MSLKTEGFDNVQRKLRDLSRRLQALDGRHEIPLTELLTVGFLASCSRFTSADEMFALSGFKIESAEDFKAIPDAEWDSFIRQNTAYPNWLEMQKAAVAAWTKGRLGL
jgi:hypothetical protein